MSPDPGAIVQADERELPRGAHLPELDLASRLLGATVVAASDEAFGEKENLLNPASASFEPGHYGPRGEVVDGWETRRRRQPGHDWVVVRLGSSGRISSVDVDTTSFTGNSPSACTFEACGFEGYPGPAELSDPSVQWCELIPRSPLLGDHHNVFSVGDVRCFSHVRLSVFPDGGVARLRVLGEMIPDPRETDGLTVDLASQQHGGVVFASSDGFYTSASMLNRPDEARTMGEGWETRRRRDDGHDFVVLRLGYAGVPRQVIVDTRHFRYNASAVVTLSGYGPSARPPDEGDDWVRLLGPTPVQPDTRHVFSLPGEAAVEWVRLDAFPDGGLSRLRMLGPVDPAARRRAGYRWFNAISASQALDCLTTAGVSPAVAGAIVAQRPLAEDWLRTSRDRVPPTEAALAASIFEGYP